MTYYNRRIRINLCAAVTENKSTPNQNLTMLWYTLIFTHTHNPWEFIRVEGQ